MNIYPPQIYFSGIKKMTNRLIISNHRSNNTDDELVDIITGVQNTQKLILKPEKASRMMFHVFALLGLIT